MERCRWEDQNFQTWKEVRRLEEEEEEEEIMWKMVQTERAQIIKYGTCTCILDNHGHTHPKYLTLTAFQSNNGNGRALGVKFYVHCLSLRWDIPVVIDRITSIDKCKHKY